MTVFGPNAFPPPRGANDGMAGALGYLTGQIIAFVIGALIGALIVALIVQVACKIVVGFKPPYRMAYKAAFLGYVAAFLIGIVVGLVLAASGQQFTETSTILLMVIGFFVQAAVYAQLIKHPDTGAIGFGNACLVCLTQLIFGALLIGAIALVVMAVALAT